jgi:hypothetical protein
MFKSPKNTGKGYLIPLKTPLCFKLKVNTPFGLDIESDWKWSLKMNIDYIDDTDHVQFLEEINLLQHHMKDFLKNEFPTTADTYFFMEPVIISKIEQTSSLKYPDKFQYNQDELLCQFRAKISVKKGKTTTTFTGNSKGETKRLLTRNDIPKNAVIDVEIFCDSWWILEKEKTIGQNWEVKNIKLY